MAAAGNEEDGGLESKRRLLYNRFMSKPMRIEFPGAAYQNPGANLLKRFEQNFYLFVISGVM
jgi:hypothetical protein